jgi:tetratricopeptide (TPR) repeat protein
MGNARREAMEKHEFNKSSEQQLAEDLLDGVWELEDKRKQARLAKKALAVDPSCCDAYTLLANNTSAIKERLELYRKALDVFERRYGIDYIRENTGMCWINRQTRPYLYAIHWYALSAWESGDRDLAIALLTRMLELDPDDNMGVRDRLVAWLIVSDDTKAGRNLLKEFPDDSTATRYFGLLLRILEEPEHLRHLEKAYELAVAANPYVIPFLLGQAKLPREKPARTDEGTREEAIAYCILSCQAWATNKQALEILEILSTNYSESFPV